MSIQSIKNNLTKAKKQGGQLSAKACCYMKHLHEVSGISQQALVAQMIVYATEMNPKYEEYREHVIRAWEQEKQHK